ncbi:DUF2225 domain-containing protein [Anaeromicropila herbilytica]|uniref:DUF2225 domain-containing protein n=1 Tax=Anaeromicropila herbilytica TaxID=2785025 RepID=A0A7R7EP54_9FIRM|nr:DUF2225 domain-containing protein [Anaeromicropila herbilytica]BCN32339.1 hypothetical protein bsdtb5_36340 [Anaeromicropila herbilytica]
MSNLFSGLEQFGLGKLSEMDIYEEEAAKKAKADSAANEVHEVKETDLLFDKTHVCPVCDNEFKSKTIRTGKVKLVSADTDLRPRYQEVDSLKYDVTVCPRCGYASVNRFFNAITSPQAKLVREQISTNFKGLKEEGDIVSYDDAIAKHKLALVNTIVKRGKTSERAYTCLKLAWLLRGKAETLPENTENIEQVKAELAKEELELITNSFEGFSNAFSKEMFPMCGMDEITVTYLVAELARRAGNHDESGRWVSRVLTSRNANERIKEKAREIKALLNSEE